MLSSEVLRAECKPGKPKTDCLWVTSGEVSCGLSGIPQEAFSMQVNNRPFQEKERSTA